MLAHYLQNVWEYPECDCAKSRSMRTYRVVTAQDTVFWGGALDAGTFEQTLNTEAANGWELVTTTTVEAPGLLGEQHQLFFVFAREATATDATR